MTTIKGKAESLTESLFALEEPWRGRFLKLVTDWATDKTWNGKPVSSEQVIVWLSDPYLQRDIGLMLAAWRGKENT